MILLEGVEITHVVPSKPRLMSAGVAGESCESGMARSHPYY